MLFCSEKKLTELQQKADDIATARKAISYDDPGQV